MKKFFVLTASAFLLTACASSSVEEKKQIPQETLVSNVTSDSISNSIQEQIDSNQEVIVLTEFFTDLDYEKISKEIDKFTQETSMSFLEKGYKLIEVETTSMGQSSRYISITLIFHKNSQ